MRRVEPAATQHRQLDRDLAGPSRRRRAAARLAGRGRFRRPVAGRRRRGSHPSRCRASCSRVPSSDWPSRAWASDGTTGLPSSPSRLGEAAPAPLGTRRRVVDLSSLWAGPLAGQLLAAAGMDVVKVESTKRPDGRATGASGVQRSAQRRQGVGGAGLLHTRRRGRAAPSAPLRGRRDRSLATPSARAAGRGRGRDRGDRFDPGLAVDHRARAH